MSAPYYYYETIGWIVLLHYLGKCGKLIALLLARLFTATRWFVTMWLDLAAEMIRPA